MDTLANILHNFHPLPVFQHREGVKPLECSLCIQAIKGKDYEQVLLGALPPRIPSLHARTVEPFGCQYHLIDHLVRSSVLPGASLPRPSRIREYEKTQRA